MPEKTLQNNIRIARKARGITMKELGIEVGVAESTISQYENGKRQPDNEMLLRLAEALNTTVGYLLGAEKEKAPAEDGRREISDSELMFALWGDADDIDEEDLEDVKRYAAFVKERKNRK